MSKITVVFADENEEYLAPLEIKFLQEFSYQIELEVISDKTYFGEFFSEPRSLDLLLISESLYSAQLLRHNVKHIFVLTENQPETKGNDSLRYIYKYSSVKNIFNEVMYASENDMSVSGGEKHSTKVIVLFSASGGTGKTTLALGLAGILTENHMRAIYVDAECLQTFHCRLKSKETIPAKACVELQTAETHLYQTLKPYIKKEGCDYLQPFCADIGSLGVDFSFYGRAIEAIKESREYEYIIVDTDHTLNKDKFSLLKQADRVALVQKPTEQDAFGIHMLLNNMSISDPDKYLFICNQCDPADQEKMADTKYSIGVYLRKYASEELSTAEGMIKMEGIKKLLYLL